MAASLKLGTSVQPLKKPTVPTVLVHCQFMDKNKQLTLLSRSKTRIYQKKCVITYWHRKFERTSKKYILKNRRELILAS